MDSDLKNDAQDLLIRYGGDAFPNLFRSAKGSIVIDSNGREILDFTSGQMCATLGHNHPAITRAIKESCDTALHMFSGMIPEPVVKLAKALADWLPSPLRKSLLLSTGSESNEAALRLAKLATGGYEVIALGGSWHGTTGGSAAATFASDRRGYGPKVPGNHMIPEPNAYRCPIDHCRDSCDMSCLNVGLKMFDMASDGAPAAIIAEPVISAGGVIVPPAGYFDCLRDAAQQRGMLLIFDEAQTAFGRVGASCSAAKLEVAPDIMTLSKTLGGGLPLAATVTSPDIEDRAHTLQQQHESIGDIRGEGLLLGVELVTDRETRQPFHQLGAVTTERCFELGLSMNIRRRPERGAVWRIAPPLTVTTDEIDLAVTILDQALVEGLETLLTGRK